MKPKINPLTTISAVVAGLLLSAGASQAAITTVNTGLFGGSAPDATVTQSISTGTGADMLVVMTSSELGGTISSDMTVTYGGVSMNLATGNLTNSAIWFLDLTTPGITGTNVVVDMSGYTTRNGFAAGWVTMDGNLGIGESIGVHATNSSGVGINTVSLTTTVETFNAVNFNGNNTSGTITVGSPLTQIYQDTNIGSARSAAGLQASVAAGTSNYQWTLTGGTLPDDYRRIDAAAFSVVPEPSAAVLGSLGLLALLRRRRS